MFEKNRSPHVEAWFEILYVLGGAIKKYRPDFLIRLKSRKMLVLEVKGQGTPENRTKRKFLDEWIRAVNVHGGFGDWAWDVSLDPADIADILQKQAVADAKPNISLPPDAHSGSAEFVREFPNLPCVEGIAITSDGRFFYGTDEGVHLRLTRLVATGGPR